MSDKEPSVCPVHGTDCVDRTRRAIEADAALVKMVLEAGVAGQQPPPHPSGSFEALERLQRAALDLIEIKASLPFAKLCPCKTCELFRAFGPHPT